MKAGAKDKKGSEMSRDAGHGPHMLVATRSVSGSKVLLERSMERSKRSLTRIESEFLDELVNFAEKYLASDLSDWTDSDNLVRILVRLGSEDVGFVFGRWDSTSLEEPVRDIKRQPPEVTLPASGESALSSVPQWAVDTFWKQFESSLRPEAEVSVTNSEVEPAAIRNAMGEPLEVSAKLERSFLFFVDQKPEANWAHDCAYALVGPNEAPEWIEAQWPPEESVTLTSLPRP